MTTRIELSDRQQGIIDGLCAAERVARADLRVDLAKDCGHVPDWQKGRWMVADDIVNMIRDLGSPDRIEGAALQLRKIEREHTRMLAVLTEIRERAPTMKNGGCWAGGIAAICLAGMDEQSDKAT